MKKWRLSGSEPLYFYLDTYINKNNCAMSMYFNYISGKFHIQMQVFYCGVRTNNETLHPIRMQYIIIIDVYCSLFLNNRTTTLAK